MKTLLSLLCMLLLQNCSKTDDSFSPSLPPITQTGANTFGCYVDGKLLTPRDGSGTFNSPDRGLRFYAFPPERLYNEIIAQDFLSNPTAGRITLHILNLENNGEGQYVIDESNCEDNVDSPMTTNIFCRIFDYNKNVYKNYCSFDNSGQITITKFDGVILSGTFNCRVKNKDNASDIIEITQGRFDINRSALSDTKFP